MSVQSALRPWNRPELFSKMSITTVKSEYRVTWIPNQEELSSVDGSIVLRRKMRQASLIMNNTG
jgi:hypothetical protein